MSYILDALKKSEQEGQESDIPPGLHSIHSNQATSENTTKIIPFSWVVCVFLLIVLSIATGSFFSREGQTVKTRQTMASTSANAQNSLTKELTPSTPSFTATPKNTSSEKIKTAAPQVTLTKHLQHPQQANIKMPPKPAMNTQRKHTPEQKNSHPEATDKSLSTATLNTPVKQVIKSPLLSPGDTIIRPSKKPTQPTLKQLLPDTSAPSLDELASHERSQIPALKYSGHIYSTNPRSSFVIINGSSRYIGDDVNGAIIESIAPKSVTMSYNGIRFRVDFI